MNISDNKILERRVSRLERQLIKNEGYDKRELGEKAMRAVEAVSKAADLVSQINISLDYDNNPALLEWKAIESSLNDMIVRINRLGFKL
jgi:hypothetical protein